MLGPTQLHPPAPPTRRSAVLHRIAAVYETPSHAYRAYANSESMASLRISEYGRTHAQSKRGAARVA